MSAPRAPRGRPASWAWLVLLALAAAATLAAARVAEQAPRLLAHGAFALDGPALHLLLVSCGAVVAAALGAAASGARGAEAASLVIATLAAGAWACAASTLDLASGALFWAAGWVLAAAAVGRAGGPERLEAAVKLQGLGAASTLTLILGAALCGALAGSTHVLEAGRLLGSLPDSAVLARVALRVLIVGAALGAAWVPFHFWAPDGLSAAPRPVALVLAVAAPLAAVLLLARLIFAFEPALETLVVNWRGGLFAIAALTALVGASVALVQPDAARVIAYLTIVQCAELIPALTQAPGSARLLVVAAGAHLVALAPVWLALAAWSGAGGEDTALSRMAGRGRDRPLPALLWIATLALAAGFPGGARFALRPALALATPPSALWALLLALSTILQWAVVIRLVRVLFLDARPPSSGAGGLDDAPWPARKAPRAWPAWALVTLALAAEIALVVSGAFSRAAAPGPWQLLPGG